jgi:hypothetical protein
MVVIRFSLEFNSSADHPLGHLSGELSLIMPVLLSNRRVRHCPLISDGIMMCPYRRRAASSAEEGWASIVVLGKKPKNRSAYHVDAKPIGAVGHSHGCLGRSTARILAW